MHNTEHRITQPLALALYLLLTLHSASASASQDIITDSGREVRLEDNGTWKFISTDRFADTKDGYRVRLKEDGTWEYLGNTPQKNSETFRSTDIEVSLSQVVFETTKDKRSVSQKTSKVTSQTVFHLDIEVSKIVKQPIQANTPVKQFIINDSKGRQYPVIDISPQLSQLTPGSKHNIIVRAEGSPQFWGVKNMMLTINSGTFSNANKIELKQDIRDIKRKRVKNFK